MSLVDWPNLDAQPGPPGVTGTSVVGTQLAAAVFHLGPGAVAPDHHHVSEEFVQVIDGSVELTVAGAVYPVRAGQGFLLPADVPHGATAGPGGCTLLECYAPPRDPFAAHPTAKERPHDGN